jgi:hypothetical protein
MQPPARLAISVTVAAPKRKSHDGVMKGVPDFAAIYSWERCPLTPRMAYYLWSIAQFLHDQWSDSVKDDPAFVLQELPPIVRRVADEVWLERFVQCFKDIENRLATGEFTYPGLAECTGDEMAVHLIARTAQAALDDDWMAMSEELASRLPDQGEDDVDFDGATEVLLADHDVLWLFQPEADGIEDPENDLNRNMAMTNLHPKRWFLPFDPE